MSAAVTVRLRSPDWIAGETFTLTDGVVTAAPKRLPWLASLTADELRDYFRVMKWEARVIRPATDPLSKPPESSAPRARP